MKVAMITDIHFDVRNGSRYFLDKYEKFFREVFFPTLDREGIKTVLHLGDNWEYRTKLNVYSMNRTFKMFFDELEKRDIKLIMLKGNHDVVFKNTNEYNSVDFLQKMYANVHVVQETETIDFDGFPINFVSWVNNENLDRCLKFINECPPTVLCGHFEIKSFEMIKGQVATHGFDKEIFRRFDKVYSGHFHTVSTDGRIFYITNPFQTNWSDYSLDKGFRIFDTANQDLQFIPNPFDVYDKIAYTDDIDLMEFDYESFRDKIVRVYIESYAKTNQAKLSLFLEKIQNVTYSCDLQEIDDTVYVNENGNIEFVDTTQMIETYIRDVVQNPNIDNDKLLSKFMDMFHEARNLVETE
ncbi:recombination endonuclease subunit [Stenotrophomonas maltophilia phage vB_SmaM_Ps15]|uniref:Recombination endonuclease subunit n=1 Tax=Stenotrophomonas maltophilia phage vB_SmaM_Ps15 TaxID=3071007 RepID=A0AAE9FHE1_9CAUD|nr:SbcD-like subunit of palindrome specific endonuclease [Stenotrophomonas maltophilia phage vB_SmaM_Ps15]UMO77273.1 recombination endonuclease subunit [Stenotrophomonas maltophilia phage vB_SmaM_Ps15]